MYILISPQTGLQDINRLGLPSALTPLICLYPPGVTSSKLQGVIRDALDSLPDFPDWLPERMRASKGWPSFHQALYEVHNPSKPDPHATRCHAPLSSAMSNVRDHIVDCEAERIVPCPGCSLSIFCVAAVCRVERGLSWQQQGSRAAGIR